MRFTFFIVLNSAHTDFHDNFASNLCFALFRVGARLVTIRFIALLFLHLYCKLGKTTLRSNSEVEPLKSSFLFVFGSPWAGPGGFLSYAR